MLHINKTVPAGIDPDLYNQNEVPHIIGVTTLYLSVSVIAVGLRFLSRWSVRAGFWWDDWLALATVPLIFTVASFDLRSTFFGYGHHQVTVLNSPKGVEHLTEFYFDMFIIFFVYIIILCTFKLSILALWVRIFRVSKLFVRICYATGAMVILWTIIALCIHVFRCSPIKASWDNNGTCIMTYTTFNYILSIPMILSSFIVLVSPIPLVLRLNLSGSKRMALLTVFFMGSGDLIVSIIRLYKATTFNLLDFTWDNFVVCSWSMAEPVFGLLCSSMITYNALFRTYWRKQPSSASSSSGGTWWRTARPKARRNPDTLGTFETLDYEEKKPRASRLGFLSSVSNSKSGLSAKTYESSSVSGLVESKDDDRSLPTPRNTEDVQGIHVTQEVSVEAQSDDPKKWDSPC